MSQEQSLREVLVNPTLVVGVGGTGCHVAKKLRKLIEDDVHPKDRDRIPMRFIGLDTHIADLTGLRWETTRRSRAFGFWKRCGWNSTHWSLRFQILCAQEV